AVAGSYSALVATLQYRMGGDQLAVLEDPDLLGERVHLDRAPAGGVGHAVEVAADADHALSGDPSLQAQHGAERRQWQGEQMRLLLGERLAHDPARGGVHPGIGDAVQPATQLLVQVVQVPERAGQEEVLADVAERPLDLALGLGPERQAGSRVAAVVEAAGFPGPAVGGA